ncbi:MAG: hypothetical protein ABI678_04470 [Kofleriaceae bacterium]
MQLADRVDLMLGGGIGSVVLALAAAGIGLLPHHCSHRAKQAVDLHRINCSGVAAGEAQPTIDVGQVTFDVPTVDPILVGLAALDVSDCLGTTPRVDMLIEIAADGHVLQASHRPEKPTRASRCIAKQVRDLEFPVAPSRVSIRYAFTK